MFCAAPRSTLCFAHSRAPPLPSLPSLLLRCSLPPSSRAAGSIRASHSTLATGPLPKLPPRDCDAGALLFWASARLLLYFSCRVPGRVKLIVPCTAARVLRFIASS
ncbi:hypothetical protein BDA96_05G091500 [Sorghum bicolor]|uniref:Uncharacterized protein n=1 Tax=Sorghum bicolor TaxID=4558 RepID=A0A921QY87_SORBI|nr:hypothetical protein BDA96_05G091500 [Sorghum bicolor]